MFFIQLIKRIPFIIRIITARRSARIDNEYKHLETADIFKKIYTEQKWGATTEGFNSGSGSSGAAAEYYIHLISTFIQHHQIKSIADVGCGDFEVSRQILKTFPNIKYTGLDVFDDIIDHNTKIHSSSNVQFIRLNAIEQPIPYAELITIRQVFQHLSNSDILRTLSNLPSNSHIIITEHVLPTSNNNLIPNLDKTSGPSIRIKNDSAVYLNLAPFNCGIEELGRIRQDSYGKEAYIVTYLLRNNKHNHQK